MLVEEAEVEATEAEAAVVTTLEAVMEVVAIPVDTRKAATAEAAVATKAEAMAEATSKAKRVASRAMAVAIKEDINRVAIRVGKVATRCYEHPSAVLRFFF